MRSFVGPLSSPMPDRNQKALSQRLPVTLSDCQACLCPFSKLSYVWTLRRQLDGVKSCICVSYSLDCSVAIGRRHRPRNKLKLRVRGTWRQARGNPTLTTQAIPTSLRSVEVTGDGAAIGEWGNPPLEAPPMSRFRDRLRNNAYIASLQAL